MIKKNNSLILTLTFFAFIWELISRIIFSSSLFFPPISKVITHIYYKIFFDHQIVIHLSYSLKRLAIATLFAITLSFVCAVTAALSPILRRAIIPLISLLYPIPKIAIFPLLLILLGLGDSSQIAIITAGIFFLLTLNTLLGFENLRSKGYLELVHIYKIDRLNFIFKILLKGAYAEILEGFKLGLGYGLTMVVAGEFAIGQNGIGHFIWNGWDQFKILDVYAGITIISLLGIATFNLIDQIKERLDQRFYGKRL